MHLTFCNDENTVEVVQVYAHPSTGLAKVLQVLSEIVDLRYNF